MTDSKGLCMNQWCQKQFYIQLNEYQWIDLTNLQNVGKKKTRNGVKRNKEDLLLSLDFIFTGITLRKR